MVGRRPSDGGAAVALRWSGNGGRAAVVGHRARQRLATGRGGGDDQARRQRRQPGERQGGGSDVEKQQEGGGGDVCGKATATVCAATMVCVARIENDSVGTIWKTKEGVWRFPNPPIFVG
jgi:hypothetical protein